MKSTNSDRQLIRVRFTRGAGLGTKLFPWARAQVYMHLHGGHLVAPQWVQFPPRIGPLLRGGIDLRSYRRQILLHGLFKKNSCEMSYCKYILSGIGDVECKEPNNLSMLVKGRIVNFEGYADGFTSINGWHSLIANKLIGSIREKWINFAELDRGEYIGVNIRMGNDFKTAKDGNYAGPIKTPLAWYRKMLELVRKLAKRNIRAIIVSDGKPSDLAGILNMENVELLRPGCAVSDLLILSKSKLLICSGASSFSAWACYLGQRPALSIPGQPLGWCGLRGMAGQIIEEFDPDDHRQHIIRQLKAIFQAEQPINN